MKIEAVTLAGESTRLEPLRPAHLDDLCAFSLDPEVQEFISLQLNTREELAAWIEKGIEGEAAGRFLAFAVIDAASGKAAGTLVLGPIRAETRSAELSAMLSPEHRRGRLSLEARYLLLRHAFETLGLMRMEFRCDPANLRSRKAMLSLGAKEEGLLRKSRITRSGLVTDSLVCSLIDDDWPAVKKTLQEKLARG